MKVISKYTIDDCVFIANHLNEKNKVNSNGWVQLYSYFVFINCFAFSAFAFILGYYWVGIGLFLLNLFFLVFLGDKIQRENYKAHYRAFFADDKFKEIEVELSDDGVSCKSVNGDSFLSWQNLNEIVETEGMIYIFTSFNGIPIAKNSFEYGSQIQEFLIFSKARLSDKLLK
jgi:hypothetical protein